jgi:GT2 family glycosyltransferase
MNSGERDVSPNVVISIVNWNGYANTLVCLESIRKLDYPGVSRVIVVDNGSRDRSVEHISREFPGVEILRSQVNLGFAGGHALALERALLDKDVALLWLLNNDTSVVPDTLTALVGAHRQFGECLYGSVPLMFSDAARIDALVGYEMTLEGLADHQRCLARFNGLTFESVFKDRSPRIVTDIHGSSFMIPLSVIRRFGFMDPSFFLYAEEADYCSRLRQHGIPCVLVPGSVVKHIHGASLGGSERLELVRLYYSTRNQLHLLRRQGEQDAFLSAFKGQGRWLIHDALAAIWRRDSRDGRRPTRADVLYRALAMFHALIGRTGKTVAPEDFLDPRLSR